METVFVLLPLALLIAGIALALFIWAVRSGQFDDLETPAVRILFDDEAPPKNGKASQQAPPSPGAQGTSEEPNHNRQSTEAASTRRDPE